MLRSSAENDMREIMRWRGWSPDSHCSTRPRVFHGNFPPESRSTNHNDVLPQKTISIQNYFSTRDEVYHRFSQV